MSDLGDLLRFDPLAAAEDLTGESYKDDEGTMALGLLMALDHNERKREALSATGDTHYNIGFDEALGILCSLGFSPVLTDTFDGTYDGERFVILWSEDGILAKAESYGANLNTAQILYNWRPVDGVRAWDFISSGHVTTDGVLVGYHDAREAVRRNVTRMRENGTFLTSWVERPWLWLLTYMDSKADDYDHTAITAERFARLPERVRSAIGEAS